MTRAVCATTALSVSELVTAARPCASRMPARSSTLSASPSPSNVRPRNSGGRRLNASRLLSTTAIWCPALNSRYDRSAPTRPHPTMTKFIGSLVDLSRSLRRRFLADPVPPSDALITDARLRPCFRFPALCLDCRTPRPRGCTERRSRQLRAWSAVPCARALRCAYEVHYATVLKE